MLICLSQTKTQNIPEKLKHTTYYLSVLNSVIYFAYNVVKILQIHSILCFNQPIL